MNECQWYSNPVPIASSVLGPFIWLLLSRVCCRLSGNSSKYNWELPRPTCSLSFREQSRQRSGTLSESPEVFVSLCAIGPVALSDGEGVGGCRDTHHGSRMGDVGGYWLNGGIKLSVIWGFFIFTIFITHYVVEGKVTTLVGRNPGLASPEPGTEEERPLVAELQTDGKAETGYAQHDLPPAGNGVMSWRWMSQSHRDLSWSLQMM